MIRFCLINYNEYMCHPYFVYAENVESVYQFMFDKEMIDFDYEDVDKENYTIFDIFKIFKKNQNDPDASFRSMIYEVPVTVGLIVPPQVLRWNKESAPKVLEYQDLEKDRQKELDITVQYIRNRELKINAFEKMRELKEIDKRLSRFKSMRRKMDV